MTKASSTAWGAIGIATALILYSAALLHALIQRRRRGMTEKKLHELILRNAAHPIPEEHFCNSGMAIDAARVVSHCL